MANKKKTDDEMVVNEQPNIIKIELSEKEKTNTELAKGRLTEYKVPENELDIVHAELEQTDIDRVSMDKKSKPYVQKFDVRAWNLFRSNAKKLGYDHVRVLYAPEGTDIAVLDPTVTETKESKQ